MSWSYFQAYSLLLCEYISASQANPFSSYLGPLTRSPSSIISRDKMEERIYETKVIEANIDEGWPDS